MTPGPWHVCEADHGQHRVLEVRARANSGGTFVAVVGPVGESRAKSDALVIACVPELVELARDVLLHVDPDALRERARKILARTQETIS